MPLQVDSFSATFISRRQSEDACRRIKDHACDLHQPHHRLLEVIKNQVFYRLCHTTSIDEKWLTLSSNLREEFDLDNFHILEVLLILANDFSFVFSADLLHLELQTPADIIKCIYDQV